MAKTTRRESSLETFLFDNWALLGLAALITTIVIARRPSSTP